MKYSSYAAWIAYKQRLIKRDFDDVNLVTAREGYGKSTWARKVALSLDPSFTVDRIHFDFEDYLAQVGTLERGQCIVLDEARIHKRESLTKDRMKILDHFKENRGLGIHHFIVFNRISSIDKDLVNDRVSDWSYLPRRGIVEVRQPKTELVFDKYGDFIDHTSYPHVATFRWKGREPEELARAYGAKKAARMRDRNATAREPEVEAPKQLPGMNAVFLDQVLAELKK